jgi:hypothetical protein
MPVRYLLLLTILALTVGCAQGYNETQPAYQEEPTQQFFTNPYKNPETEQEYQQRLWWENYESEQPRFHRWR